MLHPYIKPSVQKFVVRISAAFALVAAVVSVALSQASEQRMLPGGGACEAQEAEIFGWPAELTVLPGVRSLAQQLLARTAASPFRIEEADKMGLVQETSMPDLYVSRVGAKWAPEKHELDTTFRYYRFLNHFKKANEKVLLAPSIEHYSTPGFDGVIFNAEGIAISNFSLKSMLSLTRGSEALFPKVLDRRHEASLAVEKFATLYRWIDHFHVTEVEDDVLQLKTEVIQRGANPTLLASATRLFGIPVAISGRKTRIVIDATLPDELPMKRTEAQFRTDRLWIQRKVKDGRTDDILRITHGQPGVSVGKTQEHLFEHPELESFVLLKDDQVFEVTRTGYNLIDMVPVK